MNESVENYLKVIYNIIERQKSKGVRSIDIANELKVSKPSVSSMMQKLATLGYIHAKPYYNIFLTKKGEKEAERIVQTHRVIEVFLTDVLGRDLKEVHEEAHRLEHAFSKKSVSSLAGFLNNPKFSPHGKIIPYDDTKKKVPAKETLDKLKKDQTATIISVKGKGDIFRRLLEMGVVKGVKVKVERIAPLGDPIAIKILGYSLSMRKDEAKNIEVTLD